MSTGTIETVQLKNKAVADALYAIDAIMQEFDTKIFNVYSMLKREFKNVPAGDKETKSVIDDIMTALVDELPDRLCFMNMLWHTAEAISVDVDTEEETIDESAYEEDEYEEDEYEDSQDKEIERLKLMIVEQKQIQEELYEQIRERNLTYKLHGDAPL